MCRKTVPCMKIQKFTGILPSLDWSCVNPGVEVSGQYVLFSGF